MCVDISIVSLIIYFPIWYRGVSNENLILMSSPTQPTFEIPLVVFNITAQINEKLTPFFFPQWRAQFEALLIGYDLMDYVTSESKHHWVRQDKLILSAILASTSPTITSLIATAKTSYDAWKKLSTMYASKSRTRAMQLKEELTLIQRGNRPIMKYLHAVKGLADEIALIDHPISDNDITLYVLNGKILAFEELHDLLIGHENYLRRMEAATQQLMAAANFTTSHKGNGSPRSQGQYRFSSSNGPSRDPRRSNNQDRFNSNQRRYQPKCQYCDQMGHTAKACPQLNSSEMTVNCAGTSDGQENKWLIDSAASHNIKGDIKNLSSACENGIYIFPNSMVAPSTPKMVAYVHEWTSIDGWHKRFGHPSIKVVQNLVNLFSLLLTTNKLPLSCPSCSINKTHQQPFGSTSFQSHSPLEIIYSDVWGPARSPHAFQIATYLINRQPTPLLKHKKFGCLCYPLTRPYNTHKLQPKSIPCIFLSYSQTQNAYKCMDPLTNRFPFLSKTKHGPSAETHLFSSAPHLFLQQNPCPNFLSHPPSIPAPPSGPDRSSQPPPSSEPATAIPAPSPGISPSISPSFHCESHDNTYDMNLNLDAGIHMTVPHASLSNSLASSLIPDSQSPVHTEPTSHRTHSMTTRSMNNIFKPKQLHTVSKHYLPLPLEPTCVTQAASHPEWREAMSSELTALMRHGTWDLIPPPINCHPVGCKWVFRVKRKADGSIDKFKARLVAKGYNQQPSVDYNETFSPVVKPATIRTVLSIAIMNGWPLKQMDVNNTFLHGNLTETVYMMQPPGNDKKFVAYVVTKLGDQFSLKDMGSLHYFLGVEYVRDILENTHMAGAKDVSTPLSITKSLHLVDGTNVVNSTEYRRVIGSLQYLSLTRPDISFAINKLSQFMHKPTVTHWTATKRLLRYLKKTIFHGLHLKSAAAPCLTTYTNAD
ncbi:hypothetical protein AAG906_012890 [Vitis piasezkii]